MASRLIRAVLVATAALLAAGLSPAARGEGAICAARIYDYLREPVLNFTIDTRRTQLIAAGDYARYRDDLTAAAVPMGYDPAAAPFTLHESLSSFPFLNRGLIREVIFVLCAAGREQDSLCRRADYYVYDSVLDSARLSLMLADTLRQEVPAPVDSCDFGRGDWSAVD